MLIDLTNLPTGATTATATSRTPTTATTSTCTSTNRNGMNAFEWNNRAVQHLRRGNSSDAVLILLKTVFRLRKTRAREGVGTASSYGSNDTSSSSSVSSNSDHNSDSNLEDKFIANVPISTWPKTACQVVDRSRAEPPSSSQPQHARHHQNHHQDLRATTSSSGAIRRRPVENVFMIFDHAFVTSTGTTATTSSCTQAQYRPLAYATILYNTGLALHMKGMEDDQIRKTQMQSLHLAAKFYTMALEVLEESCHDGSSSEVLLLLLALFNNLGHIQCHFFNVKEALRCVEWLRALVNSKSLLLLPHLREEHSFFCLSVLIPPGSEFSLAPAA